MRLSRFSTRRSRFSAWQRPWTHRSALALAILTTASFISIAQAETSTREAETLLLLDEFLDSDKDGKPDDVDPDADNDGVPNAEDAFPTDPERVGRHRRRWHRKFF